MRKFVGQLDHDLRNHLNPIVLQLQPSVLAQLSASGTTAEAIAHAIDADPEEVYHVLRHLAANEALIETKGDEPGTEEFSRIK